MNKPKNLSYDLVVAPIVTMLKPVPFLGFTMLALVCFSPQVFAQSAPEPSVAVDMPAEALIGESFEIDLHFTNESDGPGAVGYGPFVDLVFPLTGIDEDDGINFNTAAFLGADVDASEATFPDDGGGQGCVDHPLVSGATVCGTTGDKLVVLRLPFGSVIPAQDDLDWQFTIDFSVTADLSGDADVGEELTFFARAGFQFGANALDNPGDDPPIFSHANQDPADWVGYGLTPEVLLLHIDYLGEDDTSDETATGGNFHQEMMVSADVATGQTITSLDLTATFPNNAQYVSVVGGTSGYAVTAAPPTNAPAPASDDELTVRFNPIIGGPGIDDAWFTFEFFVTQYDASVTQVIDPITGDAVTSVFDGEAEGNWDPTDTGDDSVTATASDTDTINDRPFAIQKSVVIVDDVGPTGLSPGDTLQYRLDLQVSDYFAFNNVVLTDVLGDGQIFDSTFEPTFDYVEHTTEVLYNPTVIPPPDETNYFGPDLVTFSDPGDGTTEITFPISAELFERRQDGYLKGGCVPSGHTDGPYPDCSVDGDQGPTTGFVVFQAVVQEDFGGTFDDISVDLGDLLLNNVTMTGDVLRTNDFGVSTASESDDGDTVLTMVFGDLTKSIYAVNGSLDPGESPEVRPGDTVTFRIQYTLPRTDFEALVITDYVPLPIFDATTVLTFDGVWSGEPPDDGHAQFGPDDTLSELRPSPTLSTVASANSLTFDFGTFDAADASSAHLDLLFTVTVNNRPFADDLYLTNLTEISMDSTNGAGEHEVAITQVNLREPLLVITKGAISTNGGGTFDPPDVGPVTFEAPPYTAPPFSAQIDSTGLLAQPINSDITGVDAGDVITFAIVIENIGGSAAYDIVIADDIPPGLTEPSAGYNISVVDGNGASLGAFGEELFGAGIELSDVARPGCEPYDSGSGTNIVVITYDLEVPDDAVPGSVFTGEGRITQYAGEDGYGDTQNHVNDPDKFRDSVSVTVNVPSMTKTRDATSHTFTSGGNVAVGEGIKYVIVITIPEGGLTNVTLLDTLDPGLTFLTEPAPTVESSSTDLTYTGPGDAVVDGQTVTWTFGTVTNASRDDSGDETIEIHYRAGVADVEQVFRGAQLNNSAVWSWDPDHSVEDSADDVNVVIPTLEVTKEANTTTVDAGDFVIYEVEIGHTTSSDTDAFDVVLTDDLDSHLSLVPADTTLTCADEAVQGETIVTGDVGGDTSILVRIDWLPNGTSCTLTYKVEVQMSAVSGTDIENTAIVTYDSLPEGGPGTPVDQERTFGPTSSEGETITVHSPTIVKTVPVDGTSEVSTGLAQGDGALEDLTIGEEVTFLLTVTLAEGTTDRVIVTDTLPSTEVGVLEYVSATVVDLSGDDVRNVSLDTPSPTPDVSDEHLGDGVNDTVTLNFGGATNTADNVVSNGDRVWIEVVARLIDRPSNASGDELTNACILQFLADGQTTGAQSFDVVEPFLTVTKGGSAETGEAGDTVTFTITVDHDDSVDHTSTADAFDVVLTDTVPVGMTCVSATLDDSTGFPATTVIEDSGVITVTWAQFPLGSTGVVTFDVTVDNGVYPTQTITNIAEISWDSLPADDDPDERDDTDSDDHVFTVVQPEITVVVFDTSEPSTDDSDINGSEDDLTIGEVVTYHATVQFSEGTTYSPNVRGQLPTVDAVFEVVSSRVVSIGSNLTGTGLSLEDAGVPSDSGDDMIDDRVVWTLGDVLNNPVGGAPGDGHDVIVFEIIAVVLDVEANEGDLDNDIPFDVTLTHRDGSRDGEVLVDLVEPFLTIEKTVHETPEQPGEAGDVYTFDMVIDHDDATSTTDAFSIEITDVLPTGMSWVGDGTVISTCVDLVTDSAAAPTVVFSFPTLAFPDGSCTITYDAVVDPVAIADTLLTNWATLQWDSTPVYTENETRRRTVQDYADVAVKPPVFVIVATDTDLTYTGTSEYDDSAFDLAIGETVSYDVTVVFPEAVTTSAVVTVSCPDSPGVLQMMTASVFSVGGNLLPTTFDPPGISNDRGGDSYSDTAVFNLGTVTNTPDGTLDADDELHLVLTCRLVDEPVNEDGDALITGAVFTYADIGYQYSGVQTDVVEPDITVVKSMEMTDLTDVDYVEITIEVTNDGTAPAFDIEIEDVFDNTLWDSASINDETIPTGFDYTAVEAGGNTTVTLSSDGTSSPPDNSIEPGETVTFVLSASFADGNRPAVSIENTASNTTTSSWWGIPNSEERTGPGGEGTGTLNVPNLSATKTDSLFDDADGSTTVSAGDILEYTIVISNTGGAATTNVEVLDVPDANTTLIVGLVQAVGGSIVTGNLAGDTDVLVQYASIEADSSVTITYQVTVNDPLPATVDTITNQALVVGDLVPDVLTDDPSTPTIPDDPTVVSVGAVPDLNVSKDDGVDSTTPGSTLTYTLTYGNTGTQDSTGVAVTETVPDYTTFDATASSPTVWSCADGSLPGTECISTIGAVDALTSATLTFAVVVDSAIPAGIHELSNSTMIEDDGTNGPDFDLGDNTALLTTTLDAVPAFTFTKVADAATPTLGDAIRYTISVTNSGNQDATGVVVTETVPDAMRYYADAAAPTVWSCPDASPAGTECTADIGDMAVGVVVELVFAVLVDDTAADHQVVVNTATVSDDGTNTGDVPVTESDDATITVEINDAPVLDEEGEPTLTDILEDDYDNDGTLVSEILADIITDEDAGSPFGLAIFIDLETDGDWEFSIDGGETWTVLGEVSEETATVLTATEDDLIRFVPDPDFFGTVQFEFYAWDGSDGLESGTQNIDIEETGGITPFSEHSLAAKLRVISVNDPPSFIKGLNEEIDEDAGPQIVESWATEISVGPENESEQILQFIVSNDLETLFSVQPAISPDGTLTYTPAPHQNGVALVTVVAQDDGGTENGGQDTSEAQTFTITVASVNDLPQCVPPTPADILSFLEGDTIEFTVAVADADGPSLTMVPIDLPTTATFETTPGVTEVAGLFSWVPGYADARDYEMAFYVTDTIDAVVCSVYVTVTYHDGDGDTLPDTWEIENDLDPNSEDTDGDGVCDWDEVGDWEDPNDTDDDGTLDAADIDSDDDWISDAEESDTDDCTVAPVDTDRDGTPDYLDTDSDDDTIPDWEEAGDDDLDTPAVDTDGDGTKDFRDPDSDNDSIFDIDDNCRIVFNPDQLDTDGDEEGDACEDDVDGDGISDEDDNCLLIYNPDQQDIDQDGRGDECDGDIDADALPNQNDNCPEHFNDQQIDLDNDGIGDVCDDDLGWRFEGGICGCAMTSEPVSGGLSVVLLLLGAVVVVRRRRRG